MTNKAADNIGIFKQDICADTFCDRKCVTKREQVAILIFVANMLPPERQDCADEKA